jgi:hypothetical protein
LRSVENGFLPRATDSSLLAPPNFPLGEDHESSVMSLMFTFRMSARFLATGISLQRPLRGKETSHGNIFIHVIPMDSDPFSNKSPFCALRWRGFEQPREPSQRR